MESQDPAKGTCGGFTCFFILLTVYEEVARDFLGTPCIARNQRKIGVIEEGTNTPHFGDWFSSVL